MGLITPESGGLQLPKAKGIERSAAPDGFEWVNGVLSPVAKQKQGIIASTTEETERIGEARAEEERERRTVERASWRDAGFGSSAFLVPDQFDFIELATKAVVARSGIAPRRMARFSADALRKAVGMAHIIDYDANNDETPKFDFYLKPEEARAVFNSLQSLYASFDAEFRANERAQEAYFATAFYITKHGKTPKKEGGGDPWSPEFLDLLIEEFPRLDRNANAYAYAKSLLKQNAKRLGESEARTVAAALHKNSDLYTDLGFLIASAHPSVLEGLPLPDARVWNLPPAELAARVERYGALASNEMPKPSSRPGSKIGYEIELALTTDDHTKIDELETFAAVSGGDHGPDGNVYELRSRDGGVRFDPRTAMSLIRLGVAAEGNPECAGIASVHINLDAHKDVQQSVFRFRKEDDVRVEAQAIGKPHTRVGTPQLAEMAVLIDQTEVLRGLYRTASAESTILSFLEQKLAALGIEKQDLFNLDPSQLECEFLIREAQRTEQPELVPAILRLYTRSAVPTTALGSQMFSMWERVPRSERTLEYSDTVAEYLRRFYYESFTLQGLLASDIESIPFPSFVSLYPMLGSTALGEVVKKCSPAPETDEILQFIAAGDHIESQARNALVGYLPATIPFSERALTALSSRRIAWSMAEKLAGKIRGHTVADIESFLLDASIEDEVKFSLVQHASDFTSIVQNESLMRRLVSSRSLSRWIRASLGVANAA